MPPFTLSTLQGDAVFAFATHTDTLPKGTARLDCLTACHAESRRRLGMAHSLLTCGCQACARIDGLDLKFNVHVGSFVIQDIAGQQELMGPEVVMAHRLLKNRAAESAPASRHRSG